MYNKSTIEANLYIRQIYWSSITGMYQTGDWYITTSLVEENPELFLDPQASLELLPLKKRGKIVDIYKHTEYWSTCTI